MQLCFQNSYINTLWVACGSTTQDMCASIGFQPGWESGAWWEIAPGDSVSTNVWTSNRYFCAYAEAEDGRVWAGNYPFAIMGGWECCKA